MQIFCSNQHLVLDAPRCAQCDWQRPDPVQTGALAWPALDLGAELGGPGLGTLAAPISVQGTVITPLSGGGVVSVDPARGHILWRTALPAGRMASGLAASAAGCWLSITDERPLGQAQPAELAQLDPHSGKLCSVWRSDTPQLSQPVLSDTQLLLRTPTQLISLDPQDPQRELWRTPLRGWWPLEPLLDQDRILLSDGRAMLGEGLLCCLDRLTGHPLWQVPTSGVLGQQAALCAQAVIFQNGRHELVAVSSASGQVLWRRSFGRIYSPPCAVQEQIYLAVRREDAPKDPDHYRLLALNPANGQTVWQTALPGRVCLPLIEIGSQLAAASDEGALLGIQMSDGKPVWQHTLTDENNPFRTRLLEVDGRLLAGTVDGHLFALQITPPTHAPLNPEQAEQVQDWELAAAGYALRGELLRAGALYRDHLQDTTKALALFEHGGAFNEAGGLAERAHQDERAEQNYLKAQNWPSAAQAQARQGKYLAAAKTYQHAADPLKAAQMFEKAGETRSALEIYRETNDSENFQRLRPQVPYTEDDIETLIDEGKLLEAGRMAVRLSRLERAIEIFHQIGALADEHDACTLLAQTLPEDWVWQRLTETARATGQFQSEAAAWEQLKQPQKAADAYLRAARQSEQVDPRAEKTIAKLYEKAAEHADEAGFEELAEQCRLDILRWRHLPKIIVRGETTRAFREEEFNELNLQVSNTGFGLARNVQVTVGGDRFEIAREASQVIYKSIPPGLAKQARLYLRPLKDQVGERVPLIVQWSWCDSEGGTHQASFNTAVQVKRRNDSQSGAPVIIQAQNYVQGNFVAGDNLQDQAQKGDQVNIRSHTCGPVTEAQNSLSPSEQPAKKLCPNCRSPIEEEDLFCNACRSPLRGGKINQQQHD